uniref:Pentatricopeptide repeat-containing protein n=1 Tax=Kalanchoe fedtschenkoi TaxID=63787 RepID=A0A7N0RH29_KALFE
MVGRMRGCGFLPKPELLASVVSACRGIGGFRFGRAVHAIVLVNDLFDEESESEPEPVAFLLTALVDLYMRFGDPVAARRVFYQIKVRNEVSWSAMVAGWCDNLDYNTAVDWLRAMQAEGIKPNRVTAVSVLSACGEGFGLRQGREIHGYAFRHGFHSERCFTGALLHMYGKSGWLRTAKLIFEGASEKDVFIWSSMIGAYGQMRKTNEMMKAFNRMREEGIEPSSVTLLPMISAFSSAASLNDGFSVHGFALKRGLDLQPCLGNSLITMYAKAGWFDAARRVFRDMPAKDPVSWTALMHACALHGQGAEALQLFSDMRARGLRPDQTALLVALSACKHAGLVEEGKKLLSYAEEEGEVELTVEHYACYIDLLAKSGLLQDACNAASSMPMKPSDGIWTSLISGFRSRGRFREAEELASELIRSEPDQAASYAMLGSVCAETGKWWSVEDIRKHTRLKRLKKTRGISQIEV